jgi:hypothetical protein
LDDQATVRLLTEIRDLLERTVANQERVLRANDESMQIYRSAARRQVIGLVMAVGLLFLFLFFLYRR